MRGMCIPGLCGSEPSANVFKVKLCFLTSCGLRMISVHYRTQRQANQVAVISFVRSAALDK
jgi:hypothetical protein